MQHALLLPAGARVVVFDVRAARDGGRGRGKEQAYVIFACVCFVTREVLTRVLEISGEPMSLNHDARYSDRSRGRGGGKAPRLMRAWMSAGGMLKRAVARNAH